jgi:hypothetical protein
MWIVLAVGTGFVNGASRTRTGDLLGAITQAIGMASSAR